MGRRRILTGVLSAVPETADNVPTIPVGTTIPSLPDSQEGFLVVDAQMNFSNRSPVWSNISHLANPETQTRESQTRSGNGHKKEKVRDLDEPEKHAILMWFVRLNGCIGKDACVSFKRDYLDPVVKIFQVTGYVTSLHGQVRRGQLVLSDMPTYETFLLSHRNLWASYSSAKYVALRNRRG